MDSSMLLALALACAPNVDARTVEALVTVESSHNPHAIGVVGGSLVRRPRQRGEAVATAKSLRASGWDFSVGLAQINVRNFERLGLSIETAFDPCTSLAAMQAVLTECFERASQRNGEVLPEPQRTVRAALSCYYSGNFVTGFRQGYVRRVVTAAARASSPSSLPKEAP
jgi:type IV secretion system protein VirB1